MCRSPSLCCFSFLSDCVIHAIRGRGTVKTTIDLRSLTVFCILLFNRNTVSIYFFFTLLALFVPVKSFAMQDAYSNSFGEHSALKMGSAGIELGLGIVPPPNDGFRGDGSINGDHSLASRLLVSSSAEMSRRRPFNSLRGYRPSDIPIDGAPRIHEALGIIVVPPIDGPRGDRRSLDWVDNFCTAVVALFLLGFLFLNMKSLWRKAFPDTDGLTGEYKSIGEWGDSRIVFIAFVQFLRDWLWHSCLDFLS